MPIDWFTVVAQILNFLVLVWILKRFLYQPVLKTMAERQERVETSMLQATREKEAKSSSRVAISVANFALPADPLSKDEPAAKKNILLGFNKT